MKIKTITLKPGFAKPLWAGNPFVYPKAADHWPTSLESGEWVRVCDANGDVIGQGVYNTHSLYRLRLLHFGKDVSLQEALRVRIAEAIALRKLLNLPNEHTNTYRLINSEGDGLSGITVDVFNTHAVVAVTAAWALIHRELLEKLFQEFFPTMQFIWRPMEKILKKEGWEESFENSVGDNIIVSENNIRYEINPYEGQKTGFYCDQRETRLLVQTYAKDRRVLDICCFSGGFSLHAALGGASSVKGIDSSAAAINSANHNANLNKLTVDFEESDALEALSKAVDVDFIILDPPKLAPSQKHARNALKYYKQLNEAALKALPSNGLLLTCSCSQAISLEDLQYAVREASITTGKQCQVIKTGSAGGDHPVHLAFPEGHYLKWVFLRVL